MATIYNYNYDKDLQKRFADLSEAAKNEGDEELARVFENQVPEKPISVGTLEKEYSCPKCKASLFNYLTWDSFRYCTFCGKRIKPRNKPNGMRGSRMDFHG